MYDLYDKLMILGAQHILEQIPQENWDQSVEKGGLDLGGPNGRFKK